MAATPAPAGRARFLDPAALARIKSMEVRVGAIMEGFWSGLHRSAKHGFSSEFSEYRHYVPGDDTRRIDWKLLAKTDKAYVKRYRDETNLRCTIAVDRSRSMDFRSADEGLSKSDYAATLAATLAHFLMLQGDAVGLASISNGIDTFIPPRSRRSHLYTILGELEKPCDSRESDLPKSLESLAQSAGRRGLFVIVSDFLCPLENLGPKLGLLPAGGHQVVVVRIADRAEIDLSLPTATHLRDLETGEQIFVSPDRERDDYIARYQSHVAAIDEACNSRGIDHYEVVTDQPVELALYDIISSRKLDGH